MLIGRGTEWQRVADVLAAARRGSGGALLLHGDAGIGKTLLLDEAARAADGFTVVRAVGYESEVGLAFAGLQQLVRPLPARVDALPAAQREALRSALGQESQRPPDPLLVGVAVLTVLAAAAEERPVVCLVDDAQWLDTPSLDALAFALRRLGEEPIAALLAARDEAGRRVRVRGVETLAMPPLPDAAARALLAERYGPRLSPSAAQTVLERSAGNPLALIELASTAAGDTAGPTGVEAAYVGRIKELPADTQSILLVAAADDAAALHVVVDAARALRADVEALEPAELAGLVSIAGGRIEFRHPLVRSAAYRNATFSQRMRAHLALAAALGGEDHADRRAWHRAAAGVGPDEDAARDLEQTARRAAARSGHAAAATAYERAAQLTAAPGTRARRLVRAAESARLAGHWSRALALLDDAPPVDDVRVRVDAARVRGVIEAQHGAPADATGTLLAAATAAYPIDRRQALELVTLAQEAAGLGGAVDQIVEFGRWAETLEPGGTVDEQIMLGLVRGFTHLVGGDRVAALPPLREATRLAEGETEPRLLLWAATAAMFAGDDRRVLHFLRRAVVEARTHGATGVLPFALHLLAGAERRVGDYAGAEADADESLRLAREVGQEVVAAGALSTLTALAALRGDIDRAEAYAREARLLGTPRRLVVALAGVERAIAELDLARGRAAEAAARLEDVVGVRDRTVVNQPYVLFTTPVYVEAAARAGRTDAALEHLTAFEQWAAEGHIGWARPLAARGRALMATDERDAEAWFVQALELHAAHPHAYETARTRLLYGEMLRRRRHKTEARTQLRAAAETFDALDARLWAARAAAELRATGATARRRDDTTRGDLTPQELQIVRLVAEGRTNPEVGTQLFLSPKTVQYHLAKVFVKLHISSRAELVRLVAAGHVRGAGA